MKVVVEMRKKMIKLRSAALLMSAAMSISAASSINAFAEEVVIQEKLEDGTNVTDDVTEEAIIPTVADPTKFDLLGNWIIAHDSKGNPDPQLIKNDDGTYVLVMYVGETLLLPVNNPWADTSTATIIDNSSDIVPMVPAKSGGTTDLVVDNSKFIQIYGWYEGSVTLEMAAYDVDTSEYIGNRVTVGVFVLPQVPGVQEPVLTQSEIEGLEWEQSEAGKKFKEKMIAEAEHSRQHHVVEVYEYPTGVKRIFDDGCVEFVRYAY